MRLVVGSFGPDIHSVDFNPETGQLTYLYRSSFGSAATWILSGRDDTTLYATDATGTYCGSGEYENNVGAVLVIKVNYDYRKSPLTKVQSILSKGDGPCHISFNTDMNGLFVANYWGGTFSSFDVDDKGIIHSINNSVIDLKNDPYFELGPNPDRQETSHPHWIGEVPLSRGKFVYGTDLGQDKIFQYEVVEGKLRPLSVPFIRTTKGSGPRSVAFHSSHPYAYVVNELNSTLSVYEYNIQTGHLVAELQCLPTVVSERQPKTCPSGILLDKANNFIYVTNRDISDDKTGSDSISVFRITSQGLENIQNISSGGLFPRHGNLSPDEKWYIVGNQGNDRLDVFSRDINTGLLAWKSGIDGVEKPTYIHIMRK